jgi:hypothetical protein
MTRENGEWTEGFLASLCGQSRDELQSAEWHRGWVDGQKTKDAGTLADSKRRAETLERLEQRGGHREFIQKQLERLKVVADSIESRKT